MTKINYNNGMVWHPTNAKVNFIIEIFRVKNWNLKFYFTIKILWRYQNFITSRRTNLCNQEWLWRYGNYEYGCL